VLGMGIFVVNRDDCGDSWGGDSWRGVHEGAFGSEFA
jgi:hypothetical protein